MDGWMDGCMMDGCMMDGCMMDGWIDGWMDVCMYVCTCMCIYIYTHTYSNCDMCPLSSNMAIESQHTEVFFNGKIRENHL